MKKLFLILLLLAGSVAAQTSPGSPSVWKRKGTADTIFVTVNNGLDTVMIYDTLNYVKLEIRGSNTAWLIPDSIRTVTLVASDRVIGANLQVGQAGGAGSLVFDNFASSVTLYSLLGNGLENISGYLTVSIGASVEGSEITNQTVAKVDMDTTIANMVFAGLYRGTSAVSDSLLPTKYYADQRLFGYPRVGTPSASQTPIFDAGLNSWTFGAGGGGGGDNTRIDMTLSSADYVLGGTTYPGGFWDISTYTLRGDTGINFVKSGQHPGDTVLGQIDWARVQRNDGTQSVRTFRTTSGDTLLVMQDSGIYTKLETSNNGGFKFEAPVHIDNNLVFDGSSRAITSLFLIGGKDDAQPLYIGDSSALYLQTGVTNKATIFGSSSNWTLWADTLKGAGNGFMYGLKRVISDTIVPSIIRVGAGRLSVQTSTDTALLMTRDTANDTTTMRVIGKLKITADAGLTEFDSAAYHGRIRMYDGTNKSRIDSASQVSADTVKTLPGGYLALQGATSGRTRIRGNASAITSYDLTLPAAQGAASQTLVNDGAGALSWSSAGGGGNGSADFDSSTAGLDSNVLKGSTGTVLLDIHKSATPNVVIGKGPTMTSLIIGGNNSGLTSADTAFLAIKGADFGNAYDDYARLDSARVVNAIRLHRYYFRATDFYGSPEAYGARYTFTSWNEADTSTFPNTMYKRNVLLYARDTNGVNVLPYNFTWIATERDTLFSTPYTVKTGFTQEDSSSLYAAALYVNETKVDTLTPLKASVAFAVDSLNWTDRQIAPGDVVTVVLWLKLNPTAASKKRVDLKEMWLNMRKY